MRFCVFASDPLFKYYEKGEVKTRYWNPRDTFDEVCVFSFCDRDVEADKVQEMVGRAKLDVIPIGFPSATGMLGQYRLVRRQLKSRRPDLIRVHNPWHAGLLGVTAGRSLNIPVVLSLHTHYDARREFEPRLLLRLLRLAERYCVRRANAVQCVSNYVADYARNLRPRSVSVIYNRVYTDQFEVAARPGGPRPLILSVGRLDPPKDQDCLIRAVRGLDAELVLVGDGENRSQLEALVRDLGMTDQVHFAGWIPNAKLPELYARADLFAIATHYEGFCIPVLEAMAAGLPVVASNTDPLPEIVAGAGRLVANEPDCFRDAMAAVLSSPDRGAALGRAARMRAEQVNGALQEDLEANLYTSIIADAKLN